MEYVPYGSADGNEAVGSDLEMMQSIGAPTTLIKSLKVAG